LEPKYEQLVVFSHADRWNRVDDYVIHHLRQLAALGFHILFVSTAHLKKEDLTRLREFCYGIWEREKLGHDFAAYQEAMLSVAKEPRYRRIVLTNDGVYGPFRDLAPIFTAMEARNLDVWSMTDSLQNEYHLQSSFLVLNRQAIEHEVMTQFWRMQKFRAENRYVEEAEGELAFSRACKGAVLLTGAWAEYRQVARRALEDIAIRLERLRQGREQPSPMTLDVNSMSDVLAEDRLRHFSRDLLITPCDPAHELWNYLIQDFGHPYLKVDLMKRNPARVMNLWMMETVIPESFPVALIENHLKRVG